ncbi:DNA-3-methyladenine glycosylase [Cellvibrio zantedeschiae]|uniref:DNA-3-methyladenine glycosylase II n=1 Tax=Cellvibrio zantedeschiae TaxID=1237077 RepID=A0ABQ3B9V2_9GAMM|nr:DNA-3-methyladenine glycosylase 2 [Cellvibrio zantedeschiae]GGY86558.1 DNA-3-methyladenine glycosylase [Cellvibrio zantedeschiae]
MNHAFSIKIPHNYRCADFLAFHQRDSQMIAEQVQNKSLIKGIMWQGQPAKLQINFQKNRADIKLNTTNTLNFELEKFQASIERMLGLQQNVKEFEAKFSDHPRLGLLIKKNPGLRVAVTSTPYEAIAWAIIGQQISLSAAISIRRRFIKLAGIQQASGLWCYPDEYCVINITEEQLRSAGFSKAKANTILMLSNHLVAQKIDLNNLKPNTESVAQLSDQLMQIRGIGPWTINYALLRGLGWLDGSLHGDVAVRRSLQTLLGANDKISEKETQQWLLDFSPWRALVAAHLWEMHKQN